VHGCLVAHQALPTPNYLGLSESTQARRTRNHMRRLHAVGTAARRLHEEPSPVVQRFHTALFNVLLRLRNGMPMSMHPLLVRLQSPSSIVVLLMDFSNSETQNIV
jgi:hypothetical protein